jgi:hypothetical protein
MFMRGLMNIARGWPDMEKAPTAKKDSRGIANQHRDDTTIGLQRNTLLYYLSQKGTYIPQRTLEVKS